MSTTSPGTRKPASVMASYAPMATPSLTQRMAVGGVGSFISSLAM